MLASRKTTWILLTWTIAAAVVAYPIHRHNQNVCDSNRTLPSGSRAELLAPLHLRLADRSSDPRDRVRCHQGEGDFLTHAHLERRRR